MSYRISQYRFYLFLHQQNLEPDSSRSPMIAAKPVPPSWAKIGGHLSHLIRTRHDMTPHVTAGLRSRCKKLQSKHTARCKREKDGQGMKRHEKAIAQGLTIAERVFQLLVRRLEFLFS
jgi:hypothetical protein